MTTTTTEPIPFPQGAPAAIGSESRLGLHRLLPDSVPPVTVALAGKFYEVSAVRLGDIAKLDAWLESKSPSLDNLYPPSFATDPEPSTRKRRLRAARHLAWDWPIRWGSEASGPVLASNEGLARWLEIILDRHNKEVPADEIAELASSMDEDDWNRLDRATWPPDPWREITRIAEREAGVRDDEEEENSAPNWEEIVADIMGAYGLSFDGIANLTLAQLGILRRRGQVAGMTGGAHIARALVEAQRKRLAVWYDPDELGPDGKVIVIGDHVADVEVPDGTGAVRPGETT